jgi:hypothetical protein
MPPVCSLWPAADGWVVTGVASLGVALRVSRGWASFVAVADRLAVPGGLGVRRLRFGWQVEGGRAGARKRCAIAVGTTPAAMAVRAGRSARVCATARTPRSRAGPVAARCRAGKE